MQKHLAKPYINNMICTVLLLNLHSLLLIYLGAILLYVFFTDELLNMYLNKYILMII